MYVIFNVGTSPFLFNVNKRGIHFEVYRTLLEAVENKIFLQGEYVHPK